MQTKDYLYRTAGYLKGRETIVQRARQVLIIFLSRNYYKKRFFR